MASPGVLTGSSRSHSDTTAARAISETSPLASSSFADAQPLSRLLSSPLLQAPAHTLSAPGNGPLAVVQGAGRKKKRNSARRRQALTL